MIRACAAGAALLVAGPALAQTDPQQVVTETATIATYTGPRSINRAELEDACASTEPLTVRVTTTSTSLTSVAADAFAWWETGSTCTGNVPGNRIATAEDIDFTTASLDFPEDFDDFGGAFHQRYLVETLGGAELCTSLGAVRSTQRRLCLAVDLDQDDTIDAPNSVDPNTGLGTTGDFFASLLIELDTAPPPPVSIVEVIPLDSSALIEVEIASPDADTETGDITRYQYRLREVGEDPEDGDCSDPNDDSFGAVQETQVNSQEALIEDLANDVTYELCLRAVDNVGNPGPWSATVTATPIDECDFIECFPGGAPSGYCGAAGGPGTALGVALLLRWRRRRRTRPARARGARGRGRGVLLASWIASLVAIPGVAQADTSSYPTFTTPRTEPLYSIGVRLGPYRPRIGQSQAIRDHVDAQYGPSFRGAPFGHGPVMVAVEGEYYFLRTVGRLGAAFSVGYWNVGGSALQCTSGPPGDAASDPVSCTPEAIEAGWYRPGATTTSLTVVPLMLSAVYRADQLMKLWDIPLMPYVRAGLNYSFWWARTGGDVSTSTVDGRTVRGEGGTLGFHATGGLALNLDWFSPVETTGDNPLGLAGSHLFVELTYLGADGFGASPNERLDLTDFTGFIGLTLDFL